MKTTFIILGIIGVIFFIAQGFIMKSSSDIEQHPYVVLKTYEDFEVRQYAPALFSSVKMKEDSYEEISSPGFRVLAGYIFGGNEKNESIAMTSPVRMEIGDTSKMSFIVPREYDLDELPKPNNGRIYFEQEEQKIMAAIAFGGWANDQKIKEYSEKLAKSLEENGIKTKGKFAYLGYNPPYQMFNRRNEIVVELDNFSL